MTKTIKVPFQTDLGGGKKSHVMYREVTGEKVGPFLVHRSISNADQRWTVTHIQTGYHCANSPLKEPAKMAALRMIDLADWDFSDPATVNSWDANVIDEIRTIRTIAGAGGI